MKEPMEKKARMTAYDSNTRFASGNRNKSAQGWSDRIIRLVQEDYSFTGKRYPEEGILFRGMSRTFMQSFVDNSFGRYSDHNPHAELENELDVIFVSHDLSDAITCSRLWQPDDDAAIMLFPTRVFNQRYDQYQAAMMLFAEPGVVFYYPMLCEPLKLDDCIAIFIHAQHAGLSEQVKNEEKVKLLQSDNRADIEQEITQWMKDRNYIGASPVDADIFPGQQ